MKVKAKKGKKIKNRGNREMRKEKCECEEDK